MERLSGAPRVDGCVAIDGRHESGGMHRFSHNAMATVFELLLVHPDEQYAAQAAHAAFELTDRLECELSRFVSNSDIARINLLTAGEGTAVGRSTMECLAVARRIFELTGGAFDISLGTGLPWLELDGEGFRVRSTRGGVQLDLGGIGKGYAVDRMAELLEEWDLDRALVHGGFSSVVALESPAGCEDWPLTLTDPVTPSRLLARVPLRQRAISGSGLRKGAHIVDPRTGHAACERLAAWAAVPRPIATGGEACEDAPRAAAGAVSDALATALMLLSADEIETLCHRSPGLEVWLLQESRASDARGPALLHFGAPTNANGSAQESAHVR